MPQVPEASDLTALATAIAGFRPPAPAELDDAVLLEVQRTIAGVSRHVDAWAASVAGEIQRRSRRELGHSGLAQRLGARTPEKLVQHLTGTSQQQSRTLVRVGALMTTPPADAPPPAPWLAQVTAAVTGGTLSLGAADAIRIGLGEPDHDVAADDLITAADELLALARTLTIEQLGVAARDARAELDLDKVADREQQTRDRRSLRFTPLPDGMTRVAGLLDPESAAHIVAAVDAATAPRRGGPRFVDPTAAASAEQLLEDERTTEQITVDVFVELTRIASLVDDGTILGSRRPVVQIHVTDRDLRERRGLGRIDGQRDPVSIATIERHICESGAIPIRFDQSGKVLDLGRAQRTFTRRQRTALAARDGGCRFPGCDRPVSWTEAHHITEWARGGTTDLAEGILLCQHHHLMIHNNGWQITREHADYYVTPPASVDRKRQRIPMPTKNRTLQRALAAR